MSKQNKNFKLSRAINKMHQKKHEDKLLSDSNSNKDLYHKVSYACIYVYMVLLVYVRCVVSMICRSTKSE